MRLTKLLILSCILFLILSVLFLSLKSKVGAQILEDADARINSSYSSNIFTQSINDFFDDKYNHVKDMDSKYIEERISVEKDTVPGGSSRIIFSVIDYLG